MTIFVADIGENKYIIIHDFRRIIFHNWGVCMEGAVSIAKFLNDPHGFKIPVYQRHYDWKISNCKRLLDDMETLEDEGRKSHFFGSVVYYLGRNNDDESIRNFIIDGQQRLTTVSLILLALSRLMEKENGEAGLEKGKQIYNDYLLFEDRYIPRLIQVADDRDNYRKLLVDANWREDNSNIYSNYRYLYDRIQNDITSKRITLDQLFDAFTKLGIVRMKLSDDDNPQRIFESINSTGLSLTEGDKIRNYMLMGQPVSRHEGYYDLYWKPLEEMVNSNLKEHDVSSFIRDYLSVKERRTPARNEIYHAFRTYAAMHGFEGKDNSKELIDDLTTYAKYYEVLVKDKSVKGGLRCKIDEKLSFTIKRLNWLKTKVTRPYFLEVLRYYEQGKLTLDEVNQVFSIVESYCFRRIVCDLPTNSLDTVFLNLHKQITDYEGDGTHEDYVEKLKYILTGKNDRTLYPKDDDFRKALDEKKVYLMGPNYRSYILERYENMDLAEGVKDVYIGLAKGDYTIEHIMPQNLNDHWKAALDPNAKDVHEKWLHRLGNLTLTMFNSSLSDHPFLKKKFLTNEKGELIGYNASGLDINKWVRKQDKWTETEIQERQKDMVEKSVKIWPYYGTDFKPKEKPMDVVTLAEAGNLKGRYIMGFSLEGERQAASAWSEAFQKIMIRLHLGNKGILEMLAYSNESYLAGIVSPTEQPKSKGYVKIEDTIYICAGVEKQTKLNNLRRFFEVFKKDPGDLVFYLRQDNDEISGDYSAEDGKVWREKYWTYALPIIQAQFADSTDGKNCFSEKQQYTNNFIATNTGVSGISLRCLAKNDSAEVALYIGKSDKEKNKQIFDTLYAHKDEIENKLDHKLGWRRLDNFKASKISIDWKDEDKEISIYQEKDWNPMANFQAAWARKFYDVFMPYLKEFK